MFQLGKTIVSEEILEREFVCNLSRCKGACCIAGEAGAPLEKEEVEILKAIYPKVKPLLRKEGIAAIEEQGTSVVSDFEELETPLVNYKECAYLVFDENHIAKCGIEERTIEDILIGKNLFLVIYTPFALKIIASLQQSITISGTFVTMPATLEKNYMSQCISLPKMHL